jgi:hypothetical protein
LREVGDMTPEKRGGEEMHQNGSPDPGAGRTDVQFYLKELRSEQCQCGAPKKSGKSLCYACWKKLPWELQYRLYLRIGDGYEEAYEAAVRRLDAVRLRGSGGSHGEA